MVCENTANKSGIASCGSTKIQDSEVIVKEVLRVAGELSTILMFPADALSKICLISGCEPTKYNKSNGRFFPAFWDDDQG